MFYCSVSFKKILFLDCRDSDLLSLLCPQDQVNKQRAAEVRLEAERRRLREALESAEARATRVEVGRRSLEGELQRLKLSLGDREAESQTSQERHDSLLKQVKEEEEQALSLHTGFRILSPARESHYCCLLV